MEPVEVEWVKLRLTEQEWKALVQEIAERMKVFRESIEPVDVCEQ